MLLTTHSFHLRNFGRFCLDECTEHNIPCAYKFHEIRNATGVFQGQVLKANPGLDQITLAGLIAYDRTTITGVVDRLVQKGLAERRASRRDRRARELVITDEGSRTLRKITPAVESAQRLMLRGLSAKEGEELMRLLRKAIAAGNELSRAPMRDA